MKGLIACLVALMLSGCVSRYPASDIAHVQQVKPDRYEIRLDYFEWVAGGPCNIAFPRKIKVQDWLYVTQMEGTLEASSIILTHERGKTEYPWPQSALRGSLVFTSGSVQVNLQIPQYRQDSSIEKYVPYRLNGSYKINAP